MEHIPEKICSCKHCQMIDIIFGDPKLNKWEIDFIDSVMRQGWYKDYSSKQKKVIEQIYRTQKDLYTKEG